MFIISYDVASKSLALSIIKFNDIWAQELQKIQTDFNSNSKLIKSGAQLCNLALECINQIENILNNLIVPLVFDVVDLIPGEKLKDTQPELRASRLKSYLQLIDYKYLNKLRTDNPEHTFKVLLEYQMGANDKSRNVCSQLLYHYSTTDTKFKQTDITNSTDYMGRITSTAYDIEIVGPSLKNKINFDKDKTMGFYTKKYAKKYDANKNHSKDNFLYWIRYWKLDKMIANIPKKNIDDIADSVNMAIAWVFIKI